MTSRCHFGRLRYLVVLIALLGGPVEGKSWAGPVEVTLDGLGAGAILNIHYEAPGSSTYQNLSVFAGQYQMHLNYGPGFGTHGSEFNSFCVDLNHAVTVGQTYLVTPMSTNVGLTAGSEIAYLYLKYGVSTMTNSVQAAALQLAIWDLSADGANGNLNSGPFQYLTHDAYYAQASAYLLEAQHMAGNSSSGWLNAAANGSGPNRGQSVLMPVPEPMTAMLFGLGVTGLLGCRRWKMTR